MKLRSILFILCLTLAFSISVRSQGDTFERLKNIKVMSSTREDVEKVVGTGENRENRTLYHYENETIRIVYSDGDCIGEWLAPKDTVVKISIHFLDHRKLSELTRKVKLKKLRVSDTYDMLGGKIYHDDENGIEYDVNIIEKTWSSITYYPSIKYSSFKCKK